MFSSVVFPMQMQAVEISDR